MLGDLDKYMKKKRKKERKKHQLTSHTRINSRWIKDLNVSRDTIRVLEETIGRKVSDIPRSTIFTNTSPRAKDIQERTVGLHQIKKLLHS